MGLIVGALTAAAWRRRTASPAHFSTDHARRHLESIAVRPRPIGSIEHHRVREYLCTQLESLGFAVVSTPVTVGRLHTDGHCEAGRVTNVHARRQADTGHNRILLVAHYDSVPHGPGAADDAMGVAVLLEIARRVVAVPPKRNRIELVFTDAEEAGLLGAKALATGSSFAGRTIVLNIDARGNRGPVLMFETGFGPRTLRRALRRRPPTATSAAEAIYRLLPNDTDFSILRQAGHDGLNFAVVDGSAGYHTPRDDLGHSSRRVLRRLGEVVESAVWELADIDFANADWRRSVYFSIFGRTWSYPVAGERLLAATAVVTTALIFWRRRGTNRSAIAASLALLPLPVAISAGIGAASWRIARLIRPHYAGFGTGDPYLPGLSRFGLTAIVSGASLGALHVLRTRFSQADVVAGLQAWLTAASATLAVFAPGAAHVMSWSAVAGGVVLLTGGPALLVAVPMALFAAPMVRLLFHALGLRRAAIPLALSSTLTIALGAGQSVPGGSVTVAIVAAGVLAWLAGTLREHPGETHPTQVSLMYASEPDEGRAYWLSRGGAPHPWVAGHTSTGEADFVDRFPVLDDGLYRFGPAPLIDRGWPRARVVASTASGNWNRIVVRISADEARLMSVFLPDSDARVQMSCDEIACSAPGPIAMTSLTMAAPAQGGFDVAFLVPCGRCLRLIILSHIAFPDEMLAPTRPTGVIWAMRNAGKAFVSRRFSFTPLVAASELDGVIDGAS